MPDDRCRLLDVALGLRRLISGCECFGFVEEQVLLIGATRFALGGEQLALRRPQSLERQVTLGVATRSPPASASRSAMSAASSSAVMVAGDDTPG
jgi:hypothetical protein